MTADEPPGARSPHGNASANGPAGRGESPWWIYQGTGRPLHDISLAELLPPPPPWRRFAGEPVQLPAPEDDAELERRLGPVGNARGRRHDSLEADAVNAALYLRRPLLVTGKPGVGKTSLAYRISRELRLGRVLRWPISSRSALREGLYHYDAIGRVHDAAAAQRRADRQPTMGGEPQPAGPRGGSKRQRGGASAAAAAAAAASDGEPDIGDYVKLGPLGTALLPHELPRVLLIDELDKSDIDLPNDLLDVFEEGEYRIHELERIAAKQPEVTVHTDDPGMTAPITRGHVRCRAFPVIIITSNGEREFPPAFLRRCLRYSMAQPDESILADMVAAHFTGGADQDTREMIKKFLQYREVHSELAADQLLNAVFLATSGARVKDASWDRLLEIVWQRLRLEAAAE